MYACAALKYTVQSKYHTCNQFCGSELAITAEYIGMNAIQEDLLAHSQYTVYEIYIDIDIDVVYELSDTGVEVYYENIGFVLSLSPSPLS